MHGRPASWSIGDYARQVVSLRRTLDATARTVPIAGPATGGKTWLSELPQFLDQARYLSVLTIHRYPVQSCYTPPSAPNHPSIANLLSPRASRGLAASAGPSIRLGHAHGLQVRVDEINTNSCGSAPNITKSFASALWATDALFAMAAAGVDGVNVHTYKKSSYELFQFDQNGNKWTARVEPEYYGLYLFALGAPPNSKLLDLNGTATKQLSAWATKAPDGHLRVTLINDDLKHSPHGRDRRAPAGRDPSDAPHPQRPQRLRPHRNQDRRSDIQRRRPTHRPPANADRRPHQRPLPNQAPAR